MLSILMLLATVPQQALPSSAPSSGAAAWQAKTAACRARVATIPADAAVAFALAERVEADQCLRRLLSDGALSTMSTAGRNAAMQHLFGEMTAQDAANTAFLKSVLPADGWFRASRDGRKTARDAWLLVQHSPDQDFQRQVVARMAPLAKAGEVEGKDYALLYDRTEMSAGRPQYYGSQYKCENGRWSLYQLRDPAGVNARRKAFGMDTVAENLAAVSANGGC